MRSGCSVRGVGEPYTEGLEGRLAPNRQIRGEGKLLPTLVNVGLQLVLRAPGLLGDQMRECGMITAVSSAVSRRTDLSVMAFTSPYVPPRSIQSPGWYAFSRRAASPSMRRRIELTRRIARRNRGAAVSANWRTQPTTSTNAGMDDTLRGVRDGAMTA